MPEELWKRLAKAAVAAMVAAVATVLSEDLIKMSDSGPADDTDEGENT